MRMRRSRLGALRADVAVRPRGGREHRLAPGHRYRAHAARYFVTFDADGGEATVGGAGAFFKYFAIGMS